MTSFGAGLGDELDCCGQPIDRRSDEQECVVFDQLLETQALGGGEDRRRILDRNRLPVRVDADDLELLAVIRRLAQGFERLIVPVDAAVSLIASTIAAYLSGSTLEAP